MFAGIPVGALPGGRATAWAVRLLLVGGAVAVTIAWFEASDTVHVDRQVDWSAGGVAGVAAITLASVLQVVAARQAVLVKLHQLVPVVDDAAVVTAPEAPPADVDSTQTLVAAPKMARYHRASCPLAAAKPVRAQKRADHEAAGRRPCGVCEP